MRDLWTKRNQCWGICQVFQIGLSNLFSRRMRKESKLLHGNREESLKKSKRKNFQNILRISSTFQNYLRNK